MRASLQYCRENGFCTSFPAELQKRQTLHGFPCITAEKRIFAQDRKAGAEYRGTGEKMDYYVVLCGANAYTQKFYFNPAFDVLPQRVKDELKVACVLFTSEVGGILTVEYDKEGNLQLRTEADEVDGTYDDINAKLKIKELQEKNRELFESLELFYRVFNGIDTESKGN